MDTRIIEYMLAISEERSLSRAAERLYISQPALSQQLKKLEQELGTPLFIRKNNAFSLTDAGRIYMNGGLSVLHIKQEAMKQLEQINHSTENSIRFGYAMTNAVEWLPAFREKFPDVDIFARYYNSQGAKEALIQGNLDVAAILTPTMDHGSLEFLPLCQDELYLALPANHPILKEEAPFKDGYEALANDYFVLSSVGTHSRELEDQTLRAMGLQPRILCETDDYTTKQYLLNRGISNGFLHKYSLKGNNAYHIRPLKHSGSTFVAAAYPKNMILTEPLKYLLRLLLNSFDEGGQRD